MQKIVLFAILSLACFLLFYRLSELLIFIGDQGWFYLSARDMLLTGNIPLVGIASSHPWLHQGAFWTYLLAVGLWLMAYNPFAGAYLSIAFCLGTIFLVYKMGSQLFSEKVGLVAAFLYATSPLVIIHARMPYHTSPIPFFVLLWFWAMYRWMKGNILFFPLVIGLLAILYNLQIVTFLLTGVTIVVWLYGVIKKRTWASNVFNKKIIFLAIGGWCFVMLPMLLYDFQHGFPQTARFMAWIGYKVLQTGGVFEGVTSTHSVGELFSFWGVMIQRLLFLQNQIVAITIFLGSFVWLSVHLFLQWRKNRVILSESLLGLVLVFSLCGILSNKTPSEAYWPMLFPFIILMISLFFVRLLKGKLAVLLVTGVIMLIGISNSYALIHSNYLMGYVGYGATFSERLAVAQEIIEKAEGKPYILIAKGGGSEFASFTMNYAYLTWWLGNAPVDEAKRVFIIEEGSSGVTLAEGDVPSE